MELNYKNIKEFLGDDILGSGITEDGERIIFEWKKLYDPREKDENYTGMLDDPEEVFTASWVTKRDENREWWCEHVYHEDGTVEELFECVPN